MTLLLLFDCCTRFLPSGGRKGGIQLQWKLISARVAFAYRNTPKEPNQKEKGQHRVEKNTKKTHNYQQQSKWAIWGHRHLIGS